MNRREFFKWMGVMSASAAAASCDPKDRRKKLVPHLVPPREGVVPGQAVFLPTTCTECPAGCGMMATVIDGRPVKLEGNPDHPENAGALCIRGQASLERLSHPERLRRPVRRAPNGRFEELGWRQAYAAIQGALGKARKQGKESVFLSGCTTGALSGLVDSFCRKLGVKRLPELEIYNHAAVRKANRAVFGRDEVPAYRIDKADVLVTLGCDLLATFLNPVAFGRQLSAARQRDLRWFHLEPHLTITGAQAGTRLPIRPGSEAHLAMFLLKRLKGRKSMPPELSAKFVDISLEDTSRMTGMSTRAVETLATALQHARAPLVLAGEVSTGQANDLATSVFVALVQWAMGMHESTLDFSRSLNMSQVGTLNDARNLASRLEAGEIGVGFLSRLPFLDSVPILPDRLARAETCVGLADFITPALEACDLILPVSNPLQAWGDARPRRGLHSVIQPVVLPDNTRSEGDILLDLAGDKTCMQEAVVAGWQNAGRALLERGFVEAAPEPVEVELRSDLAASLIEDTPIGEPDSRGLIIAPSLRGFDGRSSVIGLLGEIPDPLTTVSYGDHLCLPEEDGRELGVGPGDEVEFTSIGLGAFRLPVSLLPGLPRGIRMLAVDAASRAGFKAVALGGELLSFVPEGKLIRTDRRVALPVLSGSREEGSRRGFLPRDPDQHHHHPGKHTLYPQHEHDQYRWAMVIDLDLCSGCSACVAACYLENNVPIVGLSEHLRGREMSWIRIQPYIDGSRPVEFVPLMCQHCDHAPCEPVCPVYATYHNSEGLNAQIYNRCVGTRYCSNNCPYKARRFNWFEHPRSIPPSPLVSVRPKGVMEKCTFCIQRIRAAKDRAKDLGRLVGDGEVTPACAQTCPTGAITFGSMKDTSSRVHRLAHTDRAYRVLEELGTEPGVYYLKDGRHA